MGANTRKPTVQRIVRIEKATRQSLSMTNAANFQSLHMATSTFCFWKCLVIKRTSSKSLASSPEVEEGKPAVWLLFMVPLAGWGSGELTLSSMLVRPLSGVSEGQDNSACSSPGCFMRKNWAHQLSRKTRVFENKRINKNTSYFFNLHLDHTRSN